MLFDKEGHRGCRGLMPENTIPAMIKALDLGVTTLEMDAVITADSEVILSHEPFFNHEITTQPNGQFVTGPDERSYNIFKMRYAETQQFDVGLKPHPRFPRQQKIAAHKPRLADVIDSVEAHCRATGQPLPQYNIETKCTQLTDGLFHPEPVQFVTLLLSVIQSKGIQSRVIIQSFDMRTLQVLHRDHPGIRTSLLIEGDDKTAFEDQLHQLGFTPAIYSPDYHLVTPELIAACHQKNIQVLPWTLNTKEEIERLKKMGVDGVITDYPDLF